MIDIEKNERMMPILAKAQIAFLKGMQKANPNMDEVSAGEALGLFAAIFHERYHGISTSSSVPGNKMCNFMYMIGFKEGNMRMMTNWACELAKYYIENAVLLNDMPEIPPEPLGKIAR